MLIRFKQDYLLCLSHFLLTLIDSHHPCHITSHLALMEALAKNFGCGLRLTKRLLDDMNSSVGAFDL
jgi:hypothetical protein